MSSVSHHSIDRKVLGTNVDVVLQVQVIVNVSHARHFTSLLTSLLPEHCGRNHSIVCVPSAVYRFCQALTFREILPTPCLVMCVHLERLFPCVSDRSLDSE